jgi:hypothetical protein
MCFAKNTELSEVRIIMNSDLNIYLLIGQSNMAGRGDVQDVSPIKHSHILKFHESGWQIAEEPLHADNPNIAGVGLAMSFAIEILRKEPAAKIGLIPCAVGWSALSRWMPGNELYENAVLTTRQAMINGSIKGILWHQGENDSCNSGDAYDYGKRLKKMVKSLRSDLNAENVPFITGELGNFLRELEEFKYFDLVNQHLRRLEKSVLNYGCAAADGLTDNGDQLHFDAKSLRTFGIRYAKKYLTLGSQKFSNGKRP